MPKKSKAVDDIDEDDFADDLADDEFEGGDDNPVAGGDAAGGGGGADEGGTEAANAGKQMDKSNPFHKDPESYSIFSSITDNRYQKKIKAIATELHDFAEEHQTLLRQRLTYEELLQGMLYPGEDLIPVQPLVVKELLETTTDGETMAQRYGVKLFLTNKRLFFLDAELDRVPSLTESTDIGGMVLSKLKVTYEVTDDIWYYPVPLTNLKGMSLDIHFATTASLLIAQKRPWWSIVIALAGFGMLAFAMYDHIVVRKRTSMQGVSEGEIEATLFSIAGSLSVLGPMLFLFLKVYSKGEPKPRQQQERRVTLGVKDPITQTHVVYNLYLDDSYTIIEAKNYLSLMQEYAPHLSGLVLAD